MTLAKIIYENNGAFKKKNSWKYMVMCVCVCVTWLKKELGFVWAEGRVVIIAVLGSESVKCVPLCADVCVPLCTLYLPPNPAGWGGLVSPVSGQGSQGVIMIDFKMLEVLL